MASPADGGEIVQDENGQWVRITVKGGQAVKIPQIQVPDPNGLNPPQYRDDPSKPVTASNIEGIAVKKPPPLKLSPGQVAYDDAGNVIASVPGKAPAGAKPGAGNIKLLPGQEVVGPDGKVIATAPAKPATKSTLTPSGLDPTSVWGQFEPARQAAIAAHNAGNLTDDQFKQAMDQITQQAISGLTAAQQADVAYRQGLLANDQTQNAVNQGNNRATAAASVFNNSGNMAMDAAKNGAGGPAAAGGFLAMLNAAPQFQANMGGAPVNVQGTAGPEHIQQIAQLVTSGQAPPDANGNRLPAAIRMVAQNAGVMSPDGGPPSVQNGGVADPNAANFIGNAAASGTMGPAGFAPGG